jgi:hypothetical protein
MEDVVTHVSGRALGGNRLNSRKTYTKTLARHPKIEILLHPQEEFGAPSRKLSESQSHVRRDRATPAQYCMERLSADAHTPRRVRDRQARVLFDDLAHQLARMRRRSRLVASHKLRHMRHRLVILLQIDPEGRSVGPFKRDAPRSIHMDRVPLRLATQSMEVESRLPQLIERRRCMQGVQSNDNATLQSRRDP